MKKAIMIMAGVLVSVTFASHAQTISRIGLHGGYTLGGDIEDSDIALGGQIEIAINEEWGIELAVSHFEDDYSDQDLTLEQETTSIGLSGIFRIPLGNGLNTKLLAGVDYNLTDLDARFESSEFDGISTNVDVDDEFGFHIGAGLGYTVQENVEIFTEYRYTFLDQEADIMVSGFGLTLSESVEGSYDFGILKVGLNYLF